MPSEGGSVNNSVNVSWFVQVITFTDKHTGCTFQIRPSIKACDVYHGNQRQPSALWWKERHEVKWSEQWDSDRNKHVVMSMLITLNLSSVSREINGIKTEALTVICFVLFCFFYLLLVSTAQWLDLLLQQVAFPHLDLGGVTKDLQLVSFKEKQNFWRAKTC